MFKSTYEVKSKSFASALGLLSRYYYCCCRCHSPFTSGSLGGLQQFKLQYLKQLQQNRVLKMHILGVTCVI